MTVSIILITTAVVLLAGIAWFLHLRQTRLIRSQRAELDELRATVHGMHQVVRLAVRAAHPPDEHPSRRRHLRVINGGLGAVAAACWTAIGRINPASSAAGVMVAAALALPMAVDLDLAPGVDPLPQRIEGVRGIGAAPGGPPAVEEEKLLLMARVASEPTDESDKAETDREPPVHEPQGEARKHTGPPADQGDDPAMPGRSGETPAEHQRPERAPGGPPDGVPAGPPPGRGPDR